MSFKTKSIHTVNLSSATISTNSLATEAMTFDKTPYPNNGVSTYTYTV